MTAIEAASTGSGPAAGPTPVAPVAPALRVAGLSKRFGTTPVLDGVDLEVAEGTITAVLGPSGCGKTTLLRLVAGFEAPDAGTVALRGEVVAGDRVLLPPERRRVGVVPQEGALFPHLSVGQNVGFGLGRDRQARARVAECLALVGLPGIERSRPHQLSGGQQQRVALARALAPRPSLVVLDEPFSALDAGLRATLRDDVVAAIQADGATAVLVTHDQQEALSVADQVAVLLGGRVAQVGPPHHLYAAPVSLAVAAFVGDAVVLPGHRRGDRVETALGVMPVSEAASAPDGAVLVALRPEQVRLDELGGPRSSPAHVVGRNYYGHDGTVRLALADGTVVTARVGAVDLPPFGAPVGVRATGTAHCYPVP